MLLHSLSGSLSGNDLMELKFLCRERVSKRKLERVQSGLDLFSVLLEQNDLERGRTELLRELLTSLRRHDLLQRLDSYEAGAAAAAAPGEAGGLGAGRGRGSSRRPRGRGMDGEAWPQCTVSLLRLVWTLRARPFFSSVRAGTWKVVFLTYSAQVGPRVLLVRSKHSPTTCRTSVLTRLGPAVLG